MTDSIRIVDDDYVKRIHGSIQSGKLHRGHNVTAATSSIPSKYQTIVIDNSERKGFYSQSKRFSYDTGTNDNPGPGNYLTHGSADKTSPSYSKKGTGGFASKDNRILKHQSTCSPGPLKYALPSMLSTRNDFNRATVSSTFHKPIAKNVENKKHGMPAPNSYNVGNTKVNYMKNNNMSANAAFKSCSKRNSLNANNVENNPSPWHYEIKEEQIKPNVPSNESSFKSKTIRKMQPDGPEVPGPGSYKPYEKADPVSKVVFPKKHYLCISAPAMPLPKTPPLPGPGAYETVNYQGEPKHYMSGAAFVSTTSRWTGGGIRNPDFPGPAHYRPVENSHQSFIYNASGRWL